MREYDKFIFKPELKQLTENEFEEFYYQTSFHYQSIAYLRIDGILNVIVEHAERLGMKKIEIGEHYYFHKIIFVVKYLNFPM